MEKYLDYKESGTKKSITYQTLYFQTFILHNIDVISLFIEMCIKLKSIDKKKYT